MRTILSLSLIFFSPLTIWAQSDILVGRFQAKIIPNQFEVIPLTEKSTITELAQEGRLKKGELIARVNFDKLLEEKEEMELSIRREKMTNLDKIRELEQQGRKLQFYISLSEEERQYEKDLLSEGAAPPEEALTDLNERIALTKDESLFSEKSKRKMHEQKVKRATLTMPFDGRLQYHFVKPEDTTQAFECSPVTQFASICDDSVYFIALSITEANLTQLPEEKFSVRIPLPAGKELKGSFNYRRVEGNQKADMLVYYFTVPEQDKDSAFAMIGSTANAELHYQCPDDAKSISKAELAIDPNAEGLDNWEELIQRSYPNYNILIEAENEIIIIPQGSQP